MPVNPYSPEDALSIEQVAAWLRPGVSEGIAWVREKIRRRCANPIPVRNMGHALLFSKIEITNWLQNLERPRHAAHPPRRKKKQIDAGIAVAKRKAA